jgi:Mg-chelatase subunit ChlD
MNTNYAALALVVDRSGSMQNVVSDVKGSVKQFIGDQQKSNGRASLTVAQFDDRYEVVYDFKEIKDVDAEKFANEYSPRGATALLDAIGRTTLALKQKIASIPQTERPSRVVVAVITDGYENASKEFNLEQIKEMIKQNEALGWDFMFMGSTLDAIDVAKNIGFSGKKAAFFSSSCTDSCMQLINEKVTAARLGKEVKISEKERSVLSSKQ